MVTKKPKGLGRGLEALLGPRVADVTDDPGAALQPSTLTLDDLVPGRYQPRTRMDEGALYELAESIKAQGIMQPVLVRRLSDDDARLRRRNGTAQGQAPEQAGPPSSPEPPLYEIIAGERRFRAARLAGLDSVPVLVRDVPDEAAAAMALIENIQREDLNPLEEAQGLQRLINEFGLTHEAAAQAVGRSRSAASNLLRLLHLTEPVQTMLMAGDIDMGHARALLALEQGTQVTAANQIAARKLSVREAERLVKKLSVEFSLAASRNRRAGRPEKPRDLQRLEEELSDLLTAAVEVRVKRRTKRAGRTDEAGELAIQFGSLDELNGLIERLRQSSGP
ncbi:MAG: Chromosome (plasmid) partitioning protein ParB [Burkholderiaceae bacterium]|jgi:ParB family chromosome partitioning protein|nr:MAG: Chromosome (plasmid) partitioning protein ParB [Burkholderiaceae bacterium]